MYTNQWPYWKACWYWLWGGLITASGNRLTEHGISLLDILIKLEQRDRKKWRLEPPLISGQITDGSIAILHSMAMAASLYYTLWQHRYTTLPGSIAILHSLAASLYYTPWQHHYTTLPGSIAIPHSLPASLYYTPWQHHYTTLPRSIAISHSLAASLYYTPWQHRYTTLPMALKQAVFMLHFVCFKPAMQRL